jgi:ATP/maltotriose-dependent transcriptional regulator MalT
MTGFLEAWRPSPELVPLSGDKVTVGKDASNDVVIESDTTVSRLHAVLESFSSGWCLRDLGSRNGTFINGERIFGERVLRPGDEIRVGKTRLVYRADAAVPDSTATEGATPAPSLTERERDVLLSLCAPLLRGSLFTEPASVRDIAGELVVTEAAVRQHLLRLYAKFDVPEGGERRRVQLANEAITRGAVTVADLRAAPEG